MVHHLSRNKWSLLLKDLSFIFIIYQLLYILSLEINFLMYLLWRLHNDIYLTLGLRTGPVLEYMYVHVCVHIITIFFQN